MKTFDITPRKEIGDIKMAIKEAILDGDINNDYDQAYDYMLKEGLKLGLTIHTKEIKDQYRPVSDR